jgi:hypothetical protein
MDRHAVPPALSQHALALASENISSGLSRWQRGPALLQRGLKAQPSGIASRRGIEPSIWLSFSTRAPNDGIDAIKPWV